MTTLSIVVPVYGCGECLVALHARLVQNIQHRVDSFEIILVNDASPDESWQVIQEICAGDRRVKGVSLSRNFGQHPAICAGLEIAGGDYVVVMDCDLQDRPEEIGRLLDKIAEGYDMVLGRRAVRQDRWLKRAASSFFYRTMSFLTDTRLDPGIANFGIYRKTVVQAVIRMGDPVRFFPVMIQWVGFSSSVIDIQHGDRLTGETSYTWGQLLRLASNIILTFSNKPLRIIVKAGFVVSAGAMVYASSVIWDALVGKIAVPGWSSVIISVWFLSGIQMIVAGIVGIYVGKVFDATKNRPTYIVSRTENIEGDS